MLDFDIRILIPEPPLVNVVDVGAMDLGEVNCPYANLVKARLAKVVGFEPVQVECDKLNAKAEGFARFLPYAIGDGRRRTFHTCNYPMTSSLYEPNSPLLAKFQSLNELVQVVDRREVDTHRLDDVKEVENCDYLKVDVQGAELDVFMGAPRILADAVVVQTEVEFVPLYRGQPLFADVDQHLRRAGYSFHRFSGMAGRTFKPLVINNDLSRMASQLLWAEAVYVKDFMALESLTPEKLLRLAVILHVVYKSVDLAIQALAAYDAKLKGNLAEMYLKHLIAR